MSLLSIFPIFCLVGLKPIGHNKVFAKVAQPGSSMVFCAPLLFTMFLPFGIYKSFLFQTSYHNYEKITKLYNTRIKTLIWHVSLNLPFSVPNTSCPFVLSDGQCFHAHEQLWWQHCLVCMEQLETILYLGMQQFFCFTEVLLLLVRTSLSHTGVVISTLITSILKVLHLCKYIHD